MILTDAQWVVLEPHYLGKKNRPWANRQQWTTFSVYGLVDRSEWCAMARSASMLRALEHRFQTVPLLGANRCFKTDFRRHLW